MQYPQAFPPAPGPPPRRTGIGWWLAGCGCLGLVGVFIVAVVVLAVVGATLSSDGGRPGSGPSTADRPVDPAVAEHLATFARERDRYYQLATELDGNPAAPLVADPARFQRLEENAKDPQLSRFSAQTVAHHAGLYRAELEKRVEAARKRRVNRTGSVTEGIVDQAGDGFIDIRWDAASACPASKRKGWQTSGCVTKGDALTVHLRPESEYHAEWARRMVVLHELAHVYQRADRRTFEDRRGRVDRLLARGLFQGSEEKMADCYALTHEDRWSLSDQYVETGYGYVCNRSERRAIRRWAARIDAPLPR
ncbi:hypothetical protein FHP29_12450 [Nocardioides albidus]|uniref:Uncharacterized protein n=1 Tax=Nocardioides albidus TaxID=1517589 RepID=A0A5C4VUX8_9ACTN|nr:hypothetical protein [Nocardioides albidus]TNM39673.1 hypothetical protein FHP29_12450 [Nocardioides albidus]